MKRYRLPVHFFALAFLLACSRTNNAEQTKKGPETPGSTQQRASEQGFDAYLARSVEPISHILVVRSEFSDPMVIPSRYLALVVLPTTAEVQSLNQSEFLFACMLAKDIDRPNLIHSPDYFSARNSEALCPDEIQHDPFIGRNCDYWTVHYEDLSKFSAFYTSFRAEFATPLKRQEAADSFHAALLDVHKQYRALLDQPIFAVTIPGLEFSEHGYSIERSHFVVSLSHPFSPAHEQLTRILYKSCGVERVVHECKSMSGRRQWLSASEDIVVPVASVDEADKIIAATKSAPATLLLLFRYAGFLGCTQLCNDTPELKQEDQHDLHDIDTKKVFTALGCVELIGYRLTIPTGGGTKVVTKVMDAQ